MGAETKHEISNVPRTSILLELAALDDLDGFKSAVEQSGLPIDEQSLWYTRRCVPNTNTNTNSSKMGYEQRTPLMIAAQYNSTNVLNYILGSGQSDIHRPSVSDLATALHLAASPSVLDSLLSGGVPSSPKRNPTLANMIPSSPTTQSQCNLPDINTGVYSTDEFRMYCFKIVPCSRAYTHDWTECPFAHPGENAKRRDPKKHQYTCVPCPEYKKGSCKKGDDCEFAHGVFESWLHPAQYRTRLCKDEIGCYRKVCFFAHKKEELRPVYQATGSAIPGPDLSTPPMSPSYSPRGGSEREFAVPPPSLQLPGSRLRSSVSARDFDLGRELMKIEQQYLHQQKHHHQHHHQQQIMSPRWSSLSPVGTTNAKKQLSPPRVSSPTSVAAAAMLNSSRAAAFAQRSQSFIERVEPKYVGLSPSSPMSGGMGEWGSPNGRVNWGVGKELRKSNSFAFRGSVNNATNNYNLSKRSSPPGFNEPDVSWVNSLVRDESGFVGGGAVNGLPMAPWVEQLYIEQEQLVA